MIEQIKAIDMQMTGFLGIVTEEGSRLVISSQHGIDAHGFDQLLTIYPGLFDLADVTFGYRGHVLYVLKPKPEAGVVDWIPIAQTSLRKRTMLMLLHESIKLARELLGRELPPGQADQA